MKQVQSAGIVIYYTKDNVRLYLLLHSVLGHWDFAKGKIEQGETLLQAAHRELAEESGLTALLHNGFQQQISYNFTDYDGQPAFKTVNFFVGKAETQEVVLSDEHDAFEWLPFANSYAQLTHADTKKVLSAADAFLDKSF